jgi:uncharacterized tellurite resistance protein B-like protein
MLERLLSFLKDLPDGGSGATGLTEDPRLAAAALLIHVMDADGIRQTTESAKLREALTETYGIAGEELESLLSAGEEADREAVDLYGFTSVIKRHLDEKARADFIGLLWDVVYADGELHELEDNLVWRVAELIGVDGRVRIAQRQQAQRAAGVTGRGDR